MRTRLLPFTALLLAAPAQASPSTPDGCNLSEMGAMGFFHCLVTHNDTVEAQGEDVATLTERLETLEDLVEAQAETISGQADLIGTLEETVEAQAEALEGLETPDLSDYLTSADLPDLAGYATETWVSDQGYLTSVEEPDLTGYATEAWVAGQGYLTSVEEPDLSSYVTTDELPDLSGYATEGWVRSQGYLTAADLATLDLPQLAAIEDSLETCFESLDDMAEVLSGVVDSVADIEDNYLTADDVVDGGFSLGGWEDISPSEVEDLLDMLDEYGLIDYRGVDLCELHNDREVYLPLDHFEGQDLYWADFSYASLCGFSFRV